jgi:hypothetical protein
MYRADGGGKSLAGRRGVGSSGRIRTENPPSTLSVASRTADAGNETTATVWPFAANTSSS